MPDLVLPPQRATAVRADDVAVVGTAPTLFSGSGPAAAGTASAGGWDLAMPGDDISLGAAEPTPVAPPAPASPRATRGAAMPDFLPAMDFDGDELGASLDLVSFAPPAPAAREAQAAQLAVPVVPVTQPSGGPRAPTAGASAGPLDPYEVRALADYGPPPASPWQAGPYVVRVVLRRRELRALCAAAQAARQAADGAVLDAQAQLVEQLRDVLERDRDAAGWMVSLRALEDRMAVRGQALAGASAELAGRVQAIDAEVAAADASAEGDQATAEKLEAVLTTATGQLERVEARLRRTDIELRAALAAAAAGAAGGPPASSPQVVALEAERLARLADRDAARSEVLAARKPLDEHERAVASRRRAVDQLEKKRKAVEGSFARELSVRREGVAAAQRERRDALVEIAERAVQLRTLTIPPELLAAIDAARVAARAASHELDKHQQAIGAYDVEGFRRGAVVLGVAAAVVVVVLALLASMVTAQPA